MSVASFPKYNICNDKKVMNYSYLTPVSCDNALAKINELCKEYNDRY